MYAPLPVEKYTPEHLNILIGFYPLYNNVRAHLPVEKYTPEHLNI